MSLHRKKVPSCAGRPIPHSSQPLSPSSPVCHPFSLLPLSSPPTPRWSSWLIHSNSLLTGSQNLREERGRQGKPGQAYFANHSYFQAVWTSPAAPDRVPSPCSALHCPPLAMGEIAFLVGSALKKLLRPLTPPQGSLSQQSGCGGIRLSACPSRGSRATCGPGWL